MYGDTPVFNHKNGCEHMSDQNMEFYKTLLAVAYHYLDHSQIHPRVSSELKHIFETRMRGLNSFELLQLRDKIDLDFKSLSPLEITTYIVESVGFAMGILDIRIQHATKIEKLEQTPLI